MTQITITAHKAEWWLQLYKSFHKWCETYWACPFGLCFPPIVEGLLMPFSTINDSHRCQSSSHPFSFCGVCWPSNKLFKSMKWISLQLHQCSPESVYLLWPVSHLWARWCVQVVNSPLTHTGRKLPLLLWLSDPGDWRKHPPNLEHTVYKYLTGISVYRLGYYL